MTVIYTRTGGSAVSLAGAEADGGDGPLGLRYSPAGIIQTEPVIGSAAPARFDRGNILYRWSFTCKKKHATYEAALSYLGDHIQDIRGLGTLVFTHGSSILTLSLADVQAEGYANGATSEWSYSGQGVLS